MYAKIRKSAKGRSNCIAQTKRLRLLRSDRQMISSMSSTNAESFSEIGRPHRIDLAVSVGFTDRVSSLIRTFLLRTERLFRLGYIPIEYGMTF